MSGWQRKVQSLGQVVTFYLGDALCGINVAGVQEVTRTLEVTPIPLAPAYVAGIFNLRGHLVTVIHLAVKIGMSSTSGPVPDKCIILNNGSERIGVLVDELREVLAVDHNFLEPAPHSLCEKHGASFSYVLKAEDELIGILDIDEVLKVE
ncbi:MAG: chemotaxis protein CheW [Desulfovermiculus sp.]|nr:chemotaxis protein CheW [Desulfovermiculus sp.]